MNYPHADVDLPDGIRVEVYWNLHRKVFSVRALENYSALGIRKGRVVAYFGALAIEDPKFVVQRAGRERVLRENRKNVHAFVRGRYRAHIPNLRGKGREVSYNPYKHGYFVDKQTQCVVDMASHAVLDTMVDVGRIYPRVFCSGLTS
jgi:hypothetical protein